MQAVRQSQAHAGEKRGDNITSKFKVTLTNQKPEKIEKRDVTRKGSKTTAQGKRSRVWTDNGAE